MTKAGVKASSVTNAIRATHINTQKARALSAIVITATHARRCRKKQAHVETRLAMLKQRNMLTLDVRSPVPSVVCDMSEGDELCATALCSHNVFMATCSNGDLEHCETHGSWHEQSEIALARRCSYSSEHGVAHERSSACPHVCH